MKTIWRTAWQQQAIVVYRDDVEVDRLAAARIERVVFVHRGAGDFSGDIEMSVVESDDGFALFQAQTGFAGCVNFERLAFWRQKACVYWVSAARASLPWRLRIGGWRADASGRAFRRLEHAELAGAASRWPLEGPETWDERKKRRIEESRLFGFTTPSRASA